MAHCVIIYLFESETQTYKGEIFSIYGGIKHKHRRKPMHEFNLQTYHNLSLDGCQLVLGSFKVLVSFVQGQTFGFHVAVYLVELDNVDSPSAETCRSVRFTADQLRVKLRIR